MTHRTHRATELIQALELQPHPEGGHYREIYRSTDRVRRGAVERSAVTQDDFRFVGDLPEHADAFRTTLAAFADLL